MKLTELEPILKHEPFRPFGIRLSNGATYAFLERWNLGVPAKVIDTLFYFGEIPGTTRGWALIDVENIVEVFNP
jgi:hypothetical protein